jgi:hypothetical protein
VLFLSLIVRGPVSLVVRRKPLPSHFPNARRSHLYFFHEGFVVRVIALFLPLLSTSTFAASDINQRIKGFYSCLKTGEID